MCEMQLSLVSSSTLVVLLTLITSYRSCTQRISPTPQAAHVVAAQAQACTECLPWACEPALLAHVHPTDQEAAPRQVLAAGTTCAMSYTERLRGTLKKYGRSGAITYLGLSTLVTTGTASA